MSSPYDVTSSVPQSMPDVPLTGEYEAPAVEAIVTLNELEREVHYAGVNVTNLAA